MHRWVDHTAEVELEIDAASEEEAYADALAAFRELVGGVDEGLVAHRTFTVEATDRPALLAAWLEELVFAAEMEGFVPHRLGRLTLAPGRLEADVQGVRGDPPHLVKAVTYHRLAFAQEGDRWRATVVLDV